MAAAAPSGLNWYVAGNLFADDGWRDDSPSDVGQLFGKLGWHQTHADTSLSIGYADNSLTGNGLQEQRFLDRDFASVYTKPDETDNRATFLNLTTRHDWSQTIELQRQRVLPAHSDQHVQRRHQRRLTRSGGVSAECRGSGGARRGGLHRISDQRRECVQHAVSVLALHRQRPAPGRAGREVQRAAESQPHVPAQLRPVGSGHLAGLAAGRQRPHRRRRL